MIKPSKIAGIAAGSLEVVSEVESHARSELKSGKGLSLDRFATNSWNEHSLIRSIQLRNDEHFDNLRKLVREPIIGRVEFHDEERDSKRTLYITRGASPDFNRDYEIVSYLAPLGRIITFDAGEYGEVTIPKGTFEFKVETTAKLHPVKENGSWDSVDNEIAIENEGRFTVVSFLKLLSSQLIEKGLELDEQIDLLWLDGEESFIETGFVKPILERMSLRDQPILDRIQDEIFRMPINSRLLLTGPPGTGKTTTLIRRLGQKTKTDVLKFSESQLADVVTQETNRMHEKSWLMFSPTELLRQYVKEAFNRDDVAAPDENIRTWDEFRNYAAREKLGFLRTGAKTGRFIETRDSDYLIPNFNNLIGWYDDFRDFVDRENSKELKKSAEFLVEVPDPEISRIGRNLLPIANQMFRGKYAAGIRSLADLRPELEGLFDQLEKSISKILIFTRNRISNYDKSFPETLKSRLLEQLASEKSANAQTREDDGEVDDLEEEDGDSIDGSTRYISNARAQNLLFQAYKALARSRVSNRKVSPGSQNALLLDWLGNARQPSDEELVEMGNLLAYQSHIRRFRNMEQMLLSRIPGIYKEFRTERSKSGKWYLNAPINRSFIEGTELDLLILSTLQMAQEFLEYYRKGGHSGLPRGNLLNAVSELQWAQVMVDEATDFSIIQLACMYHLSHPSMRSFFMSGDLNQRLTSWGIKSNSELEWIDPELVRKTITVSYRHSEELINLAKSVAKLDGVDIGDVVLPDRVNSTGLPPVWKSGLGNYDSIADWLHSRISEVDGKIKKSTTIGVLVNEESDVEPLAVALTKRLRDINLKAEACKDGKVVGNDRDVRVFNIRYIKGLEFESVFFIGLDRTMEIHPDLYAKYLYVGATRAASFLGITFNGEMPPALDALKSHFGEAWN